jgi:hypothetical protein
MLSSLIDRHTHSNAMKGQIMITQSELKELLHYDPNTGIFTWKVDKAKNVKKGNIAGRKKINSYIQIQINKKLYFAHRLAWLYVHGEMPENYIDHVNGIKSDNKILNLRKATPQENQFNRKLNKKSTSGIKGITWHKTNKRWNAVLNVNNKNIHLGSFINLNIAKQVISNARNKYHGDFANHG